MYSIHSVSSQHGYGMVCLVLVVVDIYGLGRANTHIMAWFGLRGISSTFYMHAYLRYFMVGYEAINNIMAVFQYSQ